MPFVVMTKPAQGTATKKPLIDTIIDNLTYLYNELFGTGTDQLPNQSFERDADTDGVPDGWDWTSTGGVLAIDATSAGTFHGGKAAKITGTGGNTGGYLTTRDFLPATPGRNYTFRVAMKTSIASVSVKVEVLFYDINQTLVATVIPYNNSATNPVAYAHKYLTAVAPSTARFYKLRLYGVNSATNGSTYFDDCGQIDEDMSRAPNGVQGFSTSGTFNVPTNVTRVKLRAWGGGGGGEQAGLFTAPGGGGGGGEYAETCVNVPPGSILTVNVGVGGVSIQHGIPGTNGAASYVTYLTTEIIRANGGATGLNIGGGTGGTGGTGQLLLSGQNGGNGNASTSIPGVGGISAAPSFQIGGLIVGNGGYGGLSGGSGYAPQNGGQGFIIIEW